jgi:hypothetical protein
LDRDGVALVAGEEIEYAVVIRVYPTTGPMRLRLVAGSVHPEDPVGARVGDDRVRRSGAATAVPARVPEPADGVVNDLDPVGDCVLLGQRKGYLTVDADEVQLRARRHLVDDLGDGSAMDGRSSGRELTAAVVHRCHRHGKLGSELRRVVFEAEIDDRDLHAGAGLAGGLPGICLRSGDALAGNHCHRRGRERWANAPDACCAGESGQGGRRDNCLYEPAIGRLHSPAGAPDRSLGGRRIRALHDYPDAAVLHHQAGMRRQCRGRRAAATARCRRDIRKRAGQTRRDRCTRRVHDLLVDG